jgi:hypothetical protein
MTKGYVYESSWAEDRKIGVVASELLRELDKLE